ARQEHDEPDRRRHEAAWPGRVDATGARTARDVDRGLGGREAALWAPPPCHRARERSLARVVRPGGAARGDHHPATARAARRRGRRVPALVARSLVRNPWRGWGSLPPAVWLVFATTLVNRAGTMVVPFMVLYVTRYLG